MAIKLTQSENGKKATFNEINITPLTDIFLVLLIIMMVIAPGFQSMDNNITMPEINSGVAIEDKKAIVSITKDGEMYINGEKTNEGDLEEKLVEAHLIDFSGDLYDKQIEIQFLDYMRDIKKFDSVEKLIEQLKFDMQKIRGK